MLPVSLFQKSRNPDGSIQAEERTSEEVIDTLQSVMPDLVGSLPFHSYTSLKKVKQASPQFDPEGKKPPKSDKLRRVMLDFTVDKCHENPNWLMFKIHGQSFLYNQIRCMIGVLVQSSFYFHGETDKMRAFIDRSFRERINTWRVPGEGLYLDGFSGWLGGVEEKHKQASSLRILQKEVGIKKAKAERTKNEKDWEKLRVHQTKLDQLLSLGPCEEEKLGQLRSSEEIIKQRFFDECLYPQLVDPTGSYRIGPLERVFLDWFDNIVDKDGQFYNWNTRKWEYLVDEYEVDRLLKGD